MIFVFVIVICFYSFNASNITSYPTTSIPTINPTPSPTFTIQATKIINSTEYYVITTEPNDIFDSYIQCSTEHCVVRCSGDRACRYSYISTINQISTLELTCNYYSCYYLEIYDLIVDNLTIICMQRGSCYGLMLHNLTANTVEIQCKDSYYSCAYINIYDIITRNITINCPDAAFCTNMNLYNITAEMMEINCSGSCWGSTFETYNISMFSLNCNGYDSCEQITLMSAKYTEKYIQCNYYFGCNDLKIELLDDILENELSVECNVDNSCPELQVQCYKQHRKIITVASGPAYQCSNIYCCPFDSVTFDETNLCEKDKDCTIQCIEDRNSFTNIYSTCLGTIDAFYATSLTVTCTTYESDQDSISSAIRTRSCDYLNIICPQYGECNIICEDNCDYTVIDASKSVDNNIDLLCVSSGITIDSTKYSTACNGIHVRGSTTTQNVNIHCGAGCVESIFDLNYAQNVEISSYYTSCSGLGYYNIWDSHCCDATAIRIASDGDWCPEWCRSCCATYNSTFSDSVDTGSEDTCMAKTVAMAYSTINVSNARNVDISTFGISMFGALVFGNNVDFFNMDCIDLGCTNSVVYCPTDLALSCNIICDECNGVSIYISSEETEDEFFDLTLHDDYTYLKMYCEGNENYTEFTTWNGIIVCTNNNCCPFKKYDDVTFGQSNPKDGDIVNDPVVRFEISMEVYVNSTLYLDAHCYDCFEWFLQDVSNENNFTSINSKWKNHQSVTLYNKKIGTHVTMDGVQKYDVFKSYLVIKSARTKHVGYCFDDKELASRIITPGNPYNVKLKINLPINTSKTTFESDIISITTIKPPSDGKCEIVDIDQLQIFDYFTINCTSWKSYVESNDNLYYNALIRNVPILKRFTTDPASINGIVSTGIVPITVLIQDSALNIACYEIEAQFPSLKIDHNYIEFLRRRIKRYFPKANIPTYPPTLQPTFLPTIYPSTDPTFYPTTNPTFFPTFQPTTLPTIHPSTDPTIIPTINPTLNPTYFPSLFPTLEPIFNIRSSTPTLTAEITTSILTAIPTPIPTDVQTKDPSLSPTYDPITAIMREPTYDPTGIPTDTPTKEESSAPTFRPTASPTLSLDIANNDILISWYFVIIMMYEHNITSLEYTIVLVKALIDNVMSKSFVNNTINGWEDIEILSEIATINAFTSKPDVIDLEIIMNVMDHYLDGNYYFVNFSSNVQDRLTALITETQTINDNLEIAFFTVNIYNESIEFQNNITSLLIDKTLLFAHLALTESFPGEFYQYLSKNGTKNVIAKKFENLIDSVSIKHSAECGLYNQSLIIPTKFNQENNGTYDCVLATIGDNNLASNDNEYESRSNLVAVDIYRNNLETDEIDTNPMKYETDTCNPYLITLKIDDRLILNNDGEYNYQLEVGNIFPGCNFWSNAMSIWNDIGCAVYNFSEDGSIVTCACQHLTIFGLSKEDVKLQANIIGEWHFRAFNARNLATYWTVWVTILCILIISVIVCLLNFGEPDNRSLLSYGDIIFEKIKQDKLKKDITGKEIEYITNYIPNYAHSGAGIMKLSAGNKKPLCLLNFWLFVTYLRNDHTLLSIFTRTTGTNVSTKQRVACFIMYLLTMIAATGMFYGHRQSHVFGDYFASFLISLISTFPVFVIKKLFQKSKPKMIDRSIDIDEADQILTDYDNEEENDMIKEGDALLSDEEYNDMAKYQEEMNAIKSRKKMKKRLSESLSSQLDLLKTQKMDSTMNVLNKIVEEVKVSNSVSQQIKAVNDIRIALFHVIYPLRHKWKKYAWIILLIWTLIATILAIFYGLQFDVQYAKTPNIDNPHLDLFEDACWTNNKQLVIEDNLSQIQFDKLQKSLINTLSDNYGEYTESQKWLLSCLQSLLLSIFLWQPLIIYLSTWIKIWMFSWDIRMSIDPNNIYILCKKCCCSKRYISSKTEKQNVLSSDKNDPYYIIANKNRPLDIIGFFTNRDLFLKYDVNVTGLEVGGEQQHNEDAIELGKIQLSEQQNDNKQDQDEENQAKKNKFMPISQRIDDDD